MSSSALAAMVSRVLARESAPLTVVKFGATPTDSAKPWNAGAAQVIAASVTTVGMFQPAMGHGLGKLFDKKDLASDIVEMVVLAAPATGEDLSTYHSITDGGVQKRVDKWYVVKPAATVIAYVASIKK